jgi:hypothetical protein
MSVTQVQCPSCGVILKPKRPVAAGQELKCPRCATVVQVPGPTAEEVPEDGVPAPAEKTGGKGLVLLLVGLAAGVLLVCCVSSAGLGVYFALRGGGGVRLGDSLETVHRDQVQAINDMADLLATVQDQASAQQALPRVRALGPRVQQLLKRGKAYEPTTPAQQQALKQKFGDDGEAAVLRFSIQVQRVRMVPGGPAVLQELKQQVKDWPTVAIVLDMLGGVK